MASLEKINKKGSTAYRLTWYEDGLRKRLYLGSIPKTEAISAKRRIENILRTTALTKPSLYQRLLFNRQTDLSLKEFYDFYQAKRMLEVQAGALSIETLKRQLYPLKLFIELFPSRTLNSIAVSDLEKFKEHRLQAVTPYGVNKDLIDLKTVLNYTYKKGLLGTKVFDRVELYKCEKPLPETYEPAEILEIEKYVYPEIALFAFRIFKYTGMRRTELTRVKWENIKGNFEYFRLSKTKTRWHRVIPIHNHLKQILRTPSRNQPKGR